MHVTHSGERRKEKEREKERPEMGEHCLAETADTKAIENNLDIFKRFKRFT